MIEDASQNISVQMEVVVEERASEAEVHVPISYLRHVDDKMPRHILNFSVDRQIPKPEMFHPELRVNPILVTPQNHKLQVR
jgi:hypothetical protein